MTVQGQPWRFAKSTARSLVGKVSFTCCSVSRELVQPIRGSVWGAHLGWNSSTHFLVRACPACMTLRAGRYIRTAAPFAGLTWHGGEGRRFHRSWPRSMRSASLVGADRDGTARLRGSEPPWIFASALMVASLLQDTFGMSDWGAGGDAEPSRWIAGGKRLHGGQVNGIRLLNGLSRGIHGRGVRTDDVDIATASDWSFHWPRPARQWAVFCSELCHD
ncbi:hypothetical protein ABIE65_005234 [Constrictibacter sp. MBR-5]